MGFEGTSSVKEKLKTVSEELEDFVESSIAVDILREEDLVYQQGGYQAQQLLRAHQS